MAQPPYIWTTTSLNDDTTHRYMYALSVMIHSMSAAILRIEDISMDTIEKHLKELQLWSESVPNSLCVFRPDPDYFDEQSGWMARSSERMKSAKVLDLLPSNKSANQ